jgi:hypothetical protein
LQTTRSLRRLADEAEKLNTVTVEWFEADSSSGVELHPICLQCAGEVIAANL